MFAALQKTYPGITESQFETYLKKIFNYEGDILSF